MSQDRRIIVNTSEGHNKFWMMTQTTPGSGLCDIRNGRLGTAGILQRHQLDRYTAENRLREKVREGYHAVNEHEFALLNARAAIVGVLNKCEELWWAEKPSDQGSVYRYVKVGEDRLSDPDYDPILFVRIATRKDIDGRNMFTLVFTPGKAEEIRSGTSTSDGYRGCESVITNKDLQKLADKVQESMGILFNG